jgi:hypothetical protein
MAGNISSTAMAKSAASLGIFPSVAELHARLILLYSTTSSWPRFGECHNPHKPARPDNPGGQDARPFFCARRVASKRRENAQFSEKSAPPRHSPCPLCCVAKSSENCRKSRPECVCKQSSTTYSPQIAGLAASLRVLFEVSAQASRRRYHRLLAAFFVTR